MTRFAFLLTLLATPLWGDAGRAADDPVELRVLYLGNADSERADAYVEFLNQRFTKVESAERDSFDVEAAGGFDVVVLDWGQSDTDPASAESPLGERQHWSTPTVLLGSAGLLLAGPWEIMGGAG